ncbi:MAG: hypothetical protein Q8P68_01900 [Candidatus Peregrinibacteria bacterium]|nr:hypothetical protein [Candidatus Peregrinibacteria bacterium]MDZ4244513.1 hypothetical protein [Candidatus Gracilibacteria bacterium]
MSHPTLDQLKEYVKLAESRSIKDYTQVLKRFVKMHGDYFAVKDEDFAEILFLHCKNILLTDELSVDAHYNAMRLCKFAMGSGKFIVMHKEKIWEFLMDNFHHDNGNVRSAAVHAFSRFWFALDLVMTTPRIRGYIGRNKGLLEEVEKFMMHCFEHTYFLLREFVEKEFVIDQNMGESLHGILLELNSDDVKKDKMSFVTLRRVMEETFRGRLADIMAKHESYLEFAYKQLRDPLSYGLAYDGEELLAPLVVAPRVYCFKVQMKYKGNPWRNIEMLPAMSLSYLAATILEVFNFENDHCYGFYSNLEDSFASSQEKYEVFADMGEETDASSVENTLLSKVFSKIGKKMLFLFDYGDNWEFIVTLYDVIEVSEPNRYPRVGSEFGSVPKQYDYDDM